MKWTTEMDRKLGDGIAAGLSRDAIAAELGVSKNAVVGRWYRLTGGDHDPCRRRTPLSEEALECWREKERATMVALAELDQNLREMSRQEACYVAWQAGTTLDSIGRHLGVSKRYVQRLINRQSRNAN